MFKKSLITGLITSTLLAFSVQAQSANFDEIDTLGGTITLITEPMKSDSTVLRGTIDIVLLSGWKTYWRDPGNGGIPPSLTIDDTAVTAQPTLLFPAPEWIEDGEGGHAGYDRPVSIPFTLDLGTSAKPSSLSGRLMVGICKDICIPAFADVTLPIEPMVGSSMASIKVEDAIAALPVEPESLGLSINVKNAEAGSVDVVVSGGPFLDVYASGVNGEQMKRPVEISTDETSTTYRVAPLRKRDEAKKMDIFITGTTENSSFETRATADFSK